MKFFELNEIARSLLYALLFGVLAGGIYGSLSLSLSAIRKLFLTEAYVWRAERIIPDASFFASRKKADLCKKKNWYDFFFFLACGIAYIFLCYISLDGVFRIYMLLLAIVAFFFSKKTFGSFFERIIFLLYEVSFFALFIVLYILNIPIKFVFRLICRLVSPVFTQISCVVEKKLNLKMVKNKKREIEEFLSNVSIN